MAFDLENSVQQGLNRDISTNDWNVEARNFEVILGDSNTSFSIKDSLGTDVARINNDGYLSVLGEAEVHGGHLLIENDELNQKYITLKDSNGYSVSVHSFDQDPNASFSATKGSVGIDYTNGYVYINTDGATQWERLALSSETSAVTLHSAYKNDVDGSDAVITTDVTDGAVKIAGTEKLWVSADGGIDLDSGFDMDATNKDFSVNLSGTGKIDLKAATSSEVAISSGTLSIGASDGIILDGGGNNVIPKLDATDSLGADGYGWTNVYLQNVAGTDTVGLLDPGSIGAPNTTSGAAAIGTNSNNFPTFGPNMGEDSVQSALEAIDGYFQDISDITKSKYKKTCGLELNGAILTGSYASHINYTPSINFSNKKINRAMWSIPVPTDWDGQSDIGVNIVWSPSTATAGNVEWILEYKSLTLTELASTAVSTDTYTQATIGTANAIQSTGVNLIILASAINVADEIIVLNVVRNGSLVTDTYTGASQVHLVKYSYMANNIV